MVSRGINKVILIGNLGQDPEIRYLPNGGAVANITLATSTNWKDKQTGENKENTEWHRIVLFGKLAEVAGEYLRKGSQVYIEGQLRTRKWQDQNGNDRYTTEVVVNISGTMQMLGGRHLSGNNNWGNLQNNNKFGNTSTQQQRPDETQSSSINEPSIDFDDDIPF